eukprot:Ihof_evm3s348 gene=Ihof_evmTU3s348
MSALRDTNQNVAAQPRNFKNKAFGVEESRNRRRDTTVQLRKTNRDEKLMKRRNVNIEDEEEEDIDETPLATPMASENLQELTDMLYSEDPEVRHRSIQQIRKMLSKDRDPPINTVIETGAVPRIVELLGDVEHPLVQFEAAWTLTNIASGTSEQTKVVVEQGGVIAFVQLLDSPSEDVRDQSVWALGNIAGDSEMCRDYVLKCGAMPGILKVLNNTTTSALIMRNAVWTLSNLCRGKKPYPDFAVTGTALPTLARLLYSQDKEILADACWALSYLSDGEENIKIKSVIEAGVVSRMVELLSHPSEEVKTPALRALGNIVTGNEMETQVVLNANILLQMQALLQSPKANLRKEACWVLSNIGAGTKLQIQSIADANLVPLVIKCAAVDEMRVRKEAIWTLVNMLQGGTEPIVAFLVQQGVITSLVSMMRPDLDPGMLKLVLDGIDKILKVGSKRGLENEYAVFLEEAGGVDAIEALQEHSSDAVYK